MTAPKLPATPDVTPFTTRTGRPAVRLSFDSVDFDTLGALPAHEYYVTGDDHYTARCMMCDDGYRAEYSHIDEGHCYRCTGGSGERPEKGCGTMAQIAKDYRAVSGRRLGRARARRARIMAKIAKRDAWLADNPDFAAARDAWYADLRAIVEADGAWDDPEIPVDDAIEGEARRRTPFMARIEDDRITNDVLSPRQASAFVAAYGEWKAKAAAAETRIAVSRALGDPGDKAAFTGQVVFTREETRRFRGNIRYTTFYILAGTGDHEGVKVAMETGNTSLWGYGRGDEMSFTAKIKEVYTDKKGETVTKVTHARPA